RRRRGRRSRPWPLGLGIPDGVDAALDEDGGHHRPRNLAGDLHAVSPTHSAAGSVLTLSILAVDLRAMTRPSTARTAAAAAARMATATTPSSQKWFPVTATT